MPRRRRRSGRGSGAPARARARTTLSTWRISKVANGAPRQRRTPPPNGIQRVGLGLGLQEALGPEGERLRVEVGAPVHERDRGAERRARRGPRGRRPSIGAFSVRITYVSTGRTRWPSLTTASRYSWPPSSASARARRPPGGARAARTSTTSWVAVVSWPASSSVIRWSRSSPSVGSSRPRRGVEQHREHVVAALAARAAPPRSRRAAARRPRRARPSKRRCGLPGPQSRCSSGTSMIRVPAARAGRAPARARPCGRPPRRRRPCAG